MTIKDLAAMTGYSVGTVSRVLNHQPHVSDLAREVILRAAEESGFQLNTNAKELKQQHSQAILAIVRGHNNELFDLLLSAIQFRIGETPYPLVVDYIDETDNEVRRAVKLCREKKPLGVLFLGGNRENFLQDFHQISLPCVLVTNSAEDLPFSNLSSVTSDDRLAAQEAVAHLARLGHGNIAVLGGSRVYSEIARLRFQGCLEAFQDFGLPFSEDLHYETARYSYEDGYRGALALRRRNPDFTALFAMSDVMAIGAIRALKDAGLRVPEDVSVVGFDGLNLGQYMVPRLTSIAQNIQALADTSLELMRRCIEDGTAAHHEIIPVTLEQRESAVVRES